MSGVYFHTPSGTEQVSGAERARMGSLPFEIGRGILIDTLRWAENPEAHLNPNHERVSDQNGWAPTVLAHRLDYIIGGLRYDQSHALVHDGETVAHGDVVINTAIAVGSDPIRLAVRIDGQCEIHGFIEGEDRAWVADLIVEACGQGVFRQGFSIRHRDVGGWNAVVDLLRSRADEPVVMSYSVTAGWPNRKCSTWIAPNAGREWGDDPDGWRAADEDDAAWDALGESEQWRTCMDWLRASPQLLRLDPNNWGDYRFGNCLTAFDFEPRTRPDVVLAAETREPQP